MKCFHNENLKIVSLFHPIPNLYLELTHRIEQGPKEVKYNYYNKMISRF